MLATEPLARPHGRLNFPGEARQHHLIFVFVLGCLGLLRTAILKKVSRLVAPRC